MNVRCCRCALDRPRLSNFVFVLFEFPVDSFPNRSTLHGTHCYEELVFEASLSFSCTRPQAWKLSACIPVPWLYSIYRPIADEAALPSCSLLIA